jgi:hypothetical protein
VLTPRAPGAEPRCDAGDAFRDRRRRRRDRAARRGDRDRHEPARHRRGGARPPGDRATGRSLFTIDDRAPRDLRCEARSAGCARRRARQSERARSYSGRDSDAEATRKRFAVSLAETRLVEGRARVAAMRTEIERLTVTSPIEGKVWRVDVRPGEFAQAGPLAEPLMVLGDDSVLHVRVEIDQTDAHRVRETAAAVASLRGDAARQAKLSFVSFEPLVKPKRALTGDGTERVDTRVLEVIYALPADTLRSFVGQQMDVFIEAGSGPARPADGAAPRSDAMYSPRAPARWG